jgi:hypothetical protein
MFVKQGQMRLPHDYVDIVKQLVSERVRNYSQNTIHKRSSSEIFSDALWCEVVYKFIDSLVLRYLDPDASNKAPVEYKKRMRDLLYENQQMMRQIQQLRTEFDLLKERLSTTIKESNAYKDNYFRLSINTNLLLTQNNQKQQLIDDLQNENAILSSKRRLCCFR